MKRLTSFLLAAVLVCSIIMIPAGAFGSHPFYDVPEDHWAAEGVQYVYEEGLMNGLAPNTFGPDEFFTRAMFVTILGRSEGVNPNNYPGVPFSDVSDAKWGWAAPYIKWAADSGIVNGVGNNLFAPDSIITREQYCTILIRYMDATGLDFLGAPPLAPAFSDEYNIQPYALPSVMHLASYGFIESYGGYVYPEAEMTRGSIANLFSLFHRMKTYGLMPEVYSPRIDPNVTYNEIADLLVETSIFTYDWFTCPLYLNQDDSFSVYDPDLETDTLFARVIYPAIGSQNDVAELGRKHYTEAAWMSLASEQQWYEIPYDGLYLPAAFNGGPYDNMDSCALDIQPFTDTHFAVTLIPYFENKELGRIETACVFQDGYWLFTDPIPPFLDVVPLAFG